MSSRINRKPSVRSAKSLPAGSNAISRKVDITDLTSLKIIHRIKENQENLLIVYQIREELIQNVMNECQKRDIEKRCIPFAVECAYNAIMRIMDLNFYAHDNSLSDYGTTPNWIIDPPIAASPADTWAGYNVPLIKDLPESEEEISESKPSQESAGISEVPSLLTEFSTACSLISEPYGSYSASDYSECLLGPNVSEEVIPEAVMEEEEETMSEISKQISLFTKIAALYTETDPSKVYSDYKPRESVKLPKLIKLPEEKKPKPVEIKISASTLPPLRADTILQRPQTPTVNAKGDKKRSVTPKRQ